jgi:glycosyltransferase involved in cell wall biosynthesis
LHSMTIGVPSFNRRAIVVRLVRALAEQTGDEPEIQEGLEVLVVLDGSNDGSREALAALSLPVPLRVIWQPNRGLASARNRLIDEAGGEILLFLDDDMIRSPGRIARHRGGHEEGEPAVVMGASLYPEDWFALPAHLECWAQARRAHAATGTVDRFDDFSCANTSGPVRLFQDLGGFDGGFTSYRAEDTEFGYPLFADRHRIRFDPEAIAWHHQARTRELGAGSRSARVATPFASCTDIPQQWRPFHPSRRPR